MIRNLGYNYINNFLLKPNKLFIFEIKTTIRNIPQSTLFCLLLIIIIANSKPFEKKKNLLMVFYDMVLYETFGATILSVPK